MEREAFFEMEVCNQSGKWRQNSLCLQMGAHSVYFEACAVSVVAQRRLERGTNEFDLMGWIMLQNNKKKYPKITKRKQNEINKRHIHGSSRISNKYNRWKAEWQNRNKN